MGQRTVYYKPTNGKTLRENFETDYGQFRDWIISTNDQSITEDNERLVSSEFEILLKVNANEKVQEWNQPTVDLMIFEYFLTYCDIGPGQGRFQIVGPMMYTKRYEKTNKFIDKIADKRLSTIWSYLTNGRSIKNNNPFISSDNENVIGFWDYGDRDFLYHRLAKLEKGQKNNEGIEYVLSVIDEMIKDNSDLIINVEK